jgi:hypothetical protein
MIQQTSGYAAGRTRANLAKIICFDQREQLARTHMEERDQESQACGRAGVNLHAHITAGRVGRGHVMKITLTRKAQALAGVQQRRAIGEAAKRIFHRCERYRHRQDLLHVRFGKQ